MDIPVWLLNAELGKVDEYAMHLVSRNVGLWLDEHMVKGNEENLSIARRCLDVLQGIACFDLLEPNDLGSFASNIRSTTIRLRRVIDAAN